jgi:hypothetical protein
MTIEVTLSENELALAIVQFLRQKNFTCSADKITFSFAVGEDGKQVIGATAMVGTKDSTF